MTFVTAIARRFSIRLMLVVVAALALQAGAASVYASRDGADCANHVHLSHSVDRGSEAVPAGQGDGGHVHKAPCKSTCCHAACSMALLAVPATVQGPALKAGTNSMSVLQGANGVDLKGLSRPPKPPLPV